MSSELELLKQRITELEAENVEIVELRKENAELRKENTVIRDLRIKLSVSDAEIAELKRRNAETLRSNAEYNERRDAENAKLKARIEELEKNKEDSSAENVRRDVEIAEIKAEVVKLAEGAQARDNNEESKQLTSRQSEVISKEMISGYDQNAIDEIEPQSSVSSNTINLASNVYEKEDVSDHTLAPSAKSSEEKETDAFLNEEHKKRVSEEIRQRNREKKLCTAPFGQREPLSQEAHSISQNTASTTSTTSHGQKNEQGLIREMISSMEEKHAPPVTEISANLVRETSIERNGERSTQDIISLYEIARDAEKGAIEANREETLRWCYEKPNMESTESSSGEKIPLAHISKEAGPSHSLEYVDDSDDDGYDGYNGYNEYGERDRGYYYRDGRYERKTSPMMSPIISPVTA